MSMSNIFKSIKLDHNIMKSRYPMFVIGYVIGIFLAIISKIPIFGALVVMIISAPLTGQYFSIYEKNNLEKLYGMLPLKKSEVVLGRYLYAMWIVIINGAIAAVLAYVISLLTNRAMNIPEFLIYLTAGFLYVCLMVAVIFPLYFRFSFSKVYIFSNLPFYLVFIITFAFTRKTNILSQPGTLANYIVSHFIMIGTVMFILGLMLLALSCLLSCALTEKNIAVSLSTEKSEKRLYFVDNLRTFMVILVVLQHLAELYNMLYLFMMLNQAYFMGLLFLLSGYFTPGSFERKGALKFLKDRLMKLGIPTLVYILILSPIASWGYQMMHSSKGSVVKSRFALGPMWFAVMLIAFDIGYLGWQMIEKNRKEHKVESFLPKLTFYKIAFFTFILATASYLLRIIIPYGVSFIEFPSLAYFPQYLGFFIIGVFLYKRNWLQAIPGSFGQIGFVLAMLSTFILLPVALMGLNGLFIGYGSWQSAVFALWDSIFAVGMSLALITFFRRFLNSGKKFGQLLSQNSFVVYVIHAPIIIYLMLVLHSVNTNQLLKFGLTAVIGVPLCFGIAYLIRSVPYIKRIF